MGQRPMDNQGLRHFFDASAALAVLGALSNALPPLAAVAALLWYGVQLWESKTGLNWRSRWKRVFLHKKLSLEDKLAFLILALSGGGALFIFAAISRIMP